MRMWVWVVCVCVCVYLLEFFIGIASKIIMFYSCPALSSFPYPFLALWCNKGIAWRRHVSEKLFKIYYSAA
jgi:hypothetical protein